MVTVVRGTTPTFKYTFKKVDTEELTVAYITFKTCGRVILEKDMSTATVEEGAISWTLSQEETLSFPCCDDGFVVQLNWRTLDGTRGVSKEVPVRVKVNVKEVVI